MHGLAVTNILKFSIRFLTQFSAYIWGKTSALSFNFNFSFNHGPDFKQWSNACTYPRLGILESQGTRSLRDQLIWEIRLLHDVFTHVVDPTMWSNINRWVKNIRDFFWEEGFCLLEFFLGGWVGVGRGRIMGLFVLLLLAFCRFVVVVVEVF